MDVLKNCPPDQLIRIVLKIFEFREEWMDTHPDIEYFAGIPANFSDEERLDHRRMTSYLDTAYSVSQWWEAHGGKKILEPIFGKQAVHGPSMYLTVYTARGIYTYTPAGVTLTPVLMT